MNSLNSFTNLGVPRFKMRVSGTSDAIFIHAQAVWAVISLLQESVTGGLSDFLVLKMMKWTGLCFEMAFGNNNHFARHGSSKFTSLADVSDHHQVFNCAAGLALGAWPRLSRPKQAVRGQASHSLCQLIWALPVAVRHLRRRHGQPRPFTLSRQ